MTYYYAYATKSGRVYVSHKYPSFSAAYDAYFQEMNELVANGNDLSTLRWRGVWDSAGLLKAMVDHVSMSW